MIWTSLFRQIKSERREYPRIRTNNLMREISALPVLPRPTCNLVDLSERGLQFNNPRWLHPQHIMDVMINLPEAGRQIEAKVKIVWCRFIQRNRIYCRVGAMFVAIQGVDVEAIRILIKQRLGIDENCMNSKVNYLTNRIAPDYFNPKFN